MNDISGWLVGGVKLGGPGAERELHVGAGGDQNGARGELGHQRSVEVRAEDLLDLRVAVQRL